MLPIHRKPDGRRSGSNGAGASHAPTEYSDFVIHARRKTARAVEVRVYASPSGQMATGVDVPFSAKEATALHEGFRADLASSASGRMMITQAEATELGKRLASVLMPAPVLALLGPSLERVLRQPHSGLRLRLALDEPLNDLPWEYLYRPDRLEHDGISGFLLLDPRISLVREDAHPRIECAPITGRQRLAFVGSMWEHDADEWKVGEEFRKLKRALAPVSRYVAPEFAKASAPTAFTIKGDRPLAIFHYGGHCDFDDDGRAFLVREMPRSGLLATAKTQRLDVLAPALRRAGTRLVVLSACNSGFWPAVKPLLDADIPAIVGVNGAVASVSTIEFCTKLYESLAIGLTLDEALSHARLHVLEWGQQYGLFDWGLYMAYMPSPSAVLFPRPRTPATVARQHEVREQFDVTIDSTLKRVRELDGFNFSQLVTEMTKCRVLILGRFTGRRLEILQAIKRRLADHPNGYVPELFTYARPDLRDLTESAVAFASLSRFVVADLSEAKSVQSELEAIVRQLMSVPVVPLINRTGRPFATFASLERRDNVVKPVFRYRDVDHLLARLDDEVVKRAEAALERVRPPA